MDEAKFLQDQAADAAAAMRQTAWEIFGDAGRIIDPRQWAREHPWATLGVAAMTGFVVAADLLPRPGKALQARTGDSGPVDQQRTEARSHHGPLIIEDVFTVAGKFLSLVRPIVDAMIAAQLARIRDGQHNGQHSHDGHTDATEAGPLEL